MLDLFISDVHLDDARPESTQCLLGFLNGAAREADRLFILGDLFEAWIGDDVQTALTGQIAQAIKACGSAGPDVAFMAGNRDFLLGEVYADEAGMTLLAEPHALDHDGERYLLSHGDTLCTDDEVYQSFRAQVRDPFWQSDFLAMPVSERLAFAQSAREASQAHTGQASEVIMDVNDSTVSQFMIDHQTRALIHGHTHRPAIHDLTLDGQSATRIVLGDWHQRGSVLILRDGRYRLESLPFA